MNRTDIVARLRMLRGDALSAIAKSNRARRLTEDEKALARSVYGKDLAALDAAIALIEAPANHPSEDSTR